MRTPCKKTNGGPIGLVASFNMTDILIAIEVFMKISRKMPRKTNCHVTRLLVFWQCKRQYVTELQHLRVRHRIERYWNARNPGRELPKPNGDVLLVRSHFHEWIDYKGMVTFSKELLEWGRTFSGFCIIRVIRIFASRNLKKKYEFSMTDLVKGFISDPSRCINRSG